MTDKDIQEYQALTSVLSAHTNYKNHSIRQILNPKKLKYDSLSFEDKQLLSWFPEYLKGISHSIDINDSYFSTMARQMAKGWGAELESQWVQPSFNDLDKMRGLMAQYVREWSELGSKERMESMNPILEACERLFPIIETRPQVEVLVPGAGLGRLVVEFVKRGFKTQGNELSYHMLLSSNYILNSAYSENQYVICPFIHKSSHVRRRNDQLKQVNFPDFKPGDIFSLNKDYPNIDFGELMSMVAGAFEDLYGPPELGKISGTYSNDEIASNFRIENGKRFHVVATCFFLDTSTNIIDYIKAIKHTLKDDGYWINFGPLLWHFEDNDEVQVNQIKDNNTWKDIPVPLKGLELSKEDLIQLIKDMGFTFKDHQSGIQTSYGGDDNGMGGWNYEAEFWICQKTAFNEMVD